MEATSSKKENSQSEKKRPFQTTSSTHRQEPDYSRPLLQILPKDRDRLFQRLQFLYGEETSATYLPELERILKVHYAFKQIQMIERENDFIPGERFTQRDIILITYGDLFHSKTLSPLAMLAKVCDTYLKGAINTLHILPFFPFSSDKGFSIIDFETVDPNLGTWQDIEKLESRYQLMFDGVINHVSSKSRWFQEFLNGNPLYQDFFISYSSHDDLTEHQRRLIFRPRTSDILTRFQTINGPRYVWTTFSSDQIDLNYKNPKVLLRVIEILLFYIRKGADILRLDAVSYLWDEPGTRSIHLKQTHEIIKLFRDIFNIVAPTVALITETNVPHNENISYFGDGSDEANMVYNFALPPLVLHTFYTGDTTVLSEWASGLTAPSETTTFFNFLDTHDGIGLMAVKDILSKKDIDFIIKTAESHGGLISYKSDADGNKEPYEINITWYSAINCEFKNEDIFLQVKRFVASRCIALVLQGVPGIYIHGLIGTSNDINAVKTSNSNRAINRTVFDGDALIAKTLKDPNSKLFHINWELERIIPVRTKHRAFHPNGGQKILKISPHVFAVFRTSPEHDQHILSLTNVINDSISIQISIYSLDLTETEWNDLINGGEWIAERGELNVTLSPYEVVWLAPVNEIEKEIHS